MTKDLFFPTLKSHKRIENVDEETLSSLPQYTFPQILAMQADRLGSERIAIRNKAYGIWQAYHWQDYLDYVKRVALGLLGLGLKRGERVGIITDNQPEWLFSELGAQAVGAITLSLFRASGLKELTLLLNRIQAAFVVAQGQAQVDKLLESRQDLPHLRQVVYIDPTGMRMYGGNPWLLSFAELLDSGQRLDREQPDRFNRELSKGTSDEVALVVMTSGATGSSKLVMLSHRNIIDMARKWLESAPLGMGDNWISMTPPAWIVEQMWGVGVALCGGMIMNFPETPETVADDLREIGPNVIIMPARFWEDLASKIRVKISESGFMKRTLYALSQRIGEAVIDRECNKQPVPMWLGFLRRMASWIICSPLLDRIGCLQLRIAITGGQPISPDMIRFFRVNGLNFKQAYVLTEAGGVFLVQPDGEVKTETVGTPLPRTGVKIAEDHEVLVSSPSNFVGYYQEGEATAKVLTDGWLHTGDAGYFDDDGHLVLIGRKDEIIHTEDGQTFSPDFVETRLKFSPYIKEAVVYGQGMPYLTAMVNIDMENVGGWAKNRQIPYTTYADLSQQPAVEELIHGEVQRINNQLPGPMQLRKFLILYKLLDPDDEELTRTGKVRRKFVYEQYRELLEAMYTDRKEMKVTGRVRYREGQVSTIDTKVRIVSLN
ncbi:MAG: AMP-binding protein [Proteobacteria bacterium]|nr:AMP-binding protein [Pseudomonadota bacterium]